MNVIVNVSICVFRHIGPGQPGDPVVRTNGVTPHTMPPSLSSLPPGYEDAIKSNRSHRDTNGNHVIVDASNIHDEDSRPDRPNGTLAPLAVRETTTDRSERRSRKKKKKRQRESETGNYGTTTLVLGSPRKGVDPVPASSLDPRRIRPNHAPMNQPLAEPQDSSEDDRSMMNSHRIYIP